ncbi:uncharacterized protein LOC135497273 [Lineus longissimus]|uniref:uncharacterized protein LOC135497273 n=1 Tax=Lineus longissimus TaxID=88925 RepID=UPI00315D9EE6
MKIKLDHIKYQKNNDVVRYLNAMESERKRHSSLKFTAFTLLEPLYERQKAKMDRLNATMIGPVVDKEEEKEPCSWYTQIEKGCSKLPANEDLDSNLKKLSKFSKEDIRHSIPHAKDYVCLLLMSYPAVRLVNVAVQQAFQFVITEILGGMLELYQFWMQQRRIPVVQVVASPASRPPSIQLRKTSTRGRRPTSTCLN